MKEIFSTTIGRTILAGLVAITSIGIIIPVVAVSKQIKDAGRTKEVAVQEETAPLKEEKSTPTQSEYENATSEIITKIDSYFENNSTVFNVINVKESPNVQTEKEAAEAFKKLGFEGFPITYDYSMDGEYVGENEINVNSNVKHPMYQTFFISENEQVWTVFMINGVVIANPASFNVESDLETQLLVSESDNLISYNSENNQFYVTRPNESEALVKKIDKIDSDTLNRLTYDEIRDYKK